MQEYVISGLIAALLLLGWLYCAEIEAKEDALADKARLSAVVDAQKATIDDIKTLWREANLAIAERDRKIRELNTATLAAVESIGGAANDPTCDLDAALPASVANPLLLLHSQAAGHDRAAGDPGNSAAIAVSDQGNAGAAVAADNAQSRAVDGTAHNLGR